MKIRLFPAILWLALVSSDALAQDRRGASVSAIVSAAAIDSRTEASISGSFDLRFSRVVGFEVEATLVPKLRAPYPEDDGYAILAAAASTAPVIGLVYPPPSFDSPGGRMVIVSNNVRITVPTTSRSLEPYFVAGAGVASIRRTADYVFVYGYPIDVFTVPRVVPIPAPSLLPPRAEYRQKVTASAVEMALTIGGGVSISVKRQMSVDADLRMFRLLGEEDHSIGRFGVGVRYRF